MAFLEVLHLKARCQALQTQRLQVKSYRLGVQIRDYIMKPTRTPGPLDIRKLLTGNVCPEDIAIWRASCTIQPGCSTAPEIRV